MRISSEYAVVGADDFARRVSLRSNLMWLLGAGASAAAGIPTAWDMIWEFKQQLYISQRRVSPKIVSDLANPSVRSMLQTYIDSSERFPQDGAPEEYAALFEAAYPSEGDRRTYIESKLTGAKPSYGHFALATLMRAGVTKVVWTTNFDTLVADACAKVFDGTGYLTTVALDAPDLAADILSAERWPAEIKLHGDFRSRRLKNTGQELRDQDAKLRQALVDAGRRFGLVIAGYSGRDDSIMDTLSEVLSRPNPFPGGLFWLHRGDSPPLPRVSELLSQAAAKGVNGGLITIENFDETCRDIIRLLKDIDTSALDRFAADRRIWTAPAKIDGARGFPVVRLNGVPLELSPTVCRRVECNIGGYSDVVNAVSVAGVDVIATRSRAGVLAFGSDSDVRTALAPFGIKAFDLHAIETRRLRYDSAERGILREALSRALRREHGLTITRRRSADFLAPSDPQDSKWSPLRKLVGSLTGTVPKRAELHWCEGLAVRLDWANDRLWLLLEPRTVFTGITESNRAAATDFSRERTVRRYNRQLNDLISFWSEHLARGSSDLRALGVADGVDAVFRLGKETAYSMRVRP